MLRHRPHHKEQHFDGIAAAAVAAAVATAEIDIAVDRNKFVDVVVVVEWKMDNMKFHDPFDLIDRKMYRNYFDVAKYVVFDNSNNVACKFAKVLDTAARRDCWRAAYRKTLTNSSWSCCCSLTYINFRFISKRYDKFF